MAIINIKEILDPVSKFIGALGENWKRTLTGVISIIVLVYICAVGNKWFSDPDSVPTRDNHFNSHDHFSHSEKE